ncbi:carbon storage regulator CsrA [Helicobacter burdigaliensis]|uniref:carbon storage regulator CsrA n=1 Tax=Helicobacter burdigaliensis TaxID=2315334 RepID=UPI000EF71437|nr:carbon storage regulator CsrA [Helicobacter burdigaliensis]
MLILSRKENESICIGDEIVIKIVSIDKGSVKIGFEAPPNLLILREELKLAVLEENKKSLSHKELQASELPILKSKTK